MIKRTSKPFIDKLLKNNPSWKILDIGCGYTAHESANVICDIQDLTSFYKDKKFIKLNDENFPFKDNEFDFVIASHVLEHVKNVEKFIGELQRVSSKGYIELPTILDDNLVFENKNDHLWHTEFNDIENEILISKRIQYLEPVLTVSSAKNLTEYFRQSLILELYWENNIEYKIIEKIININKKLTRINLFRKFLSKIIRNVLKRN